MTDRVGIPRWQADILDAQEAARLEQHVEARLVELDAEIRRRVLERSNRSPLDAGGVRREVIREMVRERGGPADVVALLAAADACYWRMVLRHEPLIRVLTQRGWTRWGGNLDDLRMVHRMGWYRAALRWDPERGRRFPTYAAAWGRQAWQRANERQGIVANAIGSWGVLDQTSLQTRVNVPSGEGMPTLADILPAPEETDPLERAILSARMDDLSPRSRRVVLSYLAAETHHPVAADLGVAPKAVEVRYRVVQATLRDASRAHRRLRRGRERKRSLE